MSVFGLGGGGGGSGSGGTPGPGSSRSLLPKAPPTDYGAGGGVHSALDGQFQIAVEDDAHTPVATLHSGREVGVGIAGGGGAGTYSPAGSQTLPELDGDIARQPFGPGGGDGDGTELTAVGGAGGSGGANPAFADPGDLLENESQAAPLSYGVSNLDAFFQKMYAYYLEKGFWSVIAWRVTNLITLGFTIIFSCFLLLFVDWSALTSLDCQPNGTCSARSLIVSRPNLFTAPNAGEVVVFMYFLIFSLYWVWNFISLFYALRDAYEMSAFFNDTLGITDEELTSVEWFTAVEKVVALQHKTKISIVKELTALDITNRIMRKENYMIALVNMNLLDLSIPLPEWCTWAAFGSAIAHCCRSTLALCFDCTGSGTSTGAARAPARRRGSRPNAADGVGFQQMADAEDSKAEPANPAPASTKPAANRLMAFGKSLEWNIQFAVLNSMFDDRFLVRSDFYGADGIAALQRRFRWLGVLNLLLMPFIMIFMVIFFFLKHAEELHSSKSLMGPRQWTPLSCWKIREYNELSHFFQRRLTASAEPAQKYLRQFPSTISAIVAQCVAYVSGAVVAILLVMTLADSSVVLNLRVWDRPLLWHLAFFSAVLAISRAFIPTKGVVFTPGAAFAAVLKHTHYYPLHWRDRVHTFTVRDEFAEMYKGRVLIFLDEVVCVLLAPFILLFVLPDCAPRIVEFVATMTTNVSGVGHLCSYAMFDFQKCGDKLYSLNTQATRTLRGDAPADAEDDTTDPDSAGDGSDEAKGAGAGESDAAGSTGAAARKSGGRTYQSVGDDEQYGADVGPGGVGMLRRRSGGAANLGLVRPSKQGKMEKSFLTFAINHPTWRVPAGNDGSKFLTALANLGSLSNSVAQSTATMNNMAASQSLAAGLLNLRRQNSGGRQTALNSADSASPTMSPALTPIAVTPVLAPDHKSDAADHTAPGSGAASAVATPVAAATAATPHRGKLTKRPPPATGSAAAATRRLGESLAVPPTPGSAGVHASGDLSQSNRQLVSSFGDLLTLNASQLLPEMQRLDQQMPGTPGAMHASVAMAGGAVGHSTAMLGASIARLPAPPAGPTPMAGPAGPFVAADAAHTLSAHPLYASTVVPPETDDSSVVQGVSHANLFALLEDGVHAETIALQHQRHAAPPAHAHAATPSAAANQHLRHSAVIGLASRPPRHRPVHAQPQAPQRVSLHSSTAALPVTGAFQMAVAGPAADAASGVQPLPQSQPQLPALTMHRVLSNASTNSDSGASSLSPSPVPATSSRARGGGGGAAGDTPAMAGGLMLDQRQSPLTPAGPFSFAPAPVAAPVPDLYGASSVASLGAAVRPADSSYAAAAAAAAAAEQQLAAASVHASPATSQTLPPFTVNPFAAPPDTDLTHSAASTASGSVASGVGAGFAAAAPAPPAAAAAAATQPAASASSVASPSSGNDPEGLAFGMPASSVGGDSEDGGVPEPPDGDLL